MNPMPDSINVDSHETELRRAVENCARLETWCVRVVVVALIFEAVVLWWYVDPKKWHETAWLILCDVVLALAIGGEIIFEVRRSKHQSELQNISDQKVAASLERAAEANARAAETKLALEKFREWRVLSPEQIDRVAGQLKQFSGTRYDAIMSRLDPEYAELLGYIVTALAKAGWVQSDNETWPEGTVEKPRVGLFGAMVTDVKIGINSAVPLSEIPTLVNAGNALADVLTVEGIKATSDATHNPMARTTVMHLLIGRKT
jgi:hypothetical protein